jgi:hypothetical protein
MNAALPRPRRESARFPQPSMGSRSARRSLRNGASVCVHRCERRQAVRPASIDGTARASTVQCATLPASDHSSDLGCSRNGAANTYTNRSARLARVGSTCVRPLHPHAVHRAALADATRIEHAWSDQHREPTKSPFSQADCAWREVALLQQAGHRQDSTRVAAHWKQWRKTRNPSALWGNIVERAGGLLGSREAGSRGRGVQQEPTAWNSPHLGRSTSVGQRCTHANDMCKRRAAASEASPVPGSNT